MGLIHVLIACDLAATIPLAASAVHSTPSGSCKLLLLLLCCCCCQHTLRALKNRAGLLMWTATPRRMQL